jgi:hypothetical protein
VFTPLVDILTFLKVNTLVITKENINDYELRSKSFIKSLIESLIPLKSLIYTRLRNESPVESLIESLVNYIINFATGQLEVRPF